MNEILIFIWRWRIDQNFKSIMHSEIEDEMDKLASNRQTTI